MVELSAHNGNAVGSIPSESTNISSVKPYKMVIRYIGYITYICDGIIEGVELKWLCMQYRRKYVQSIKRTLCAVMDELLTSIDAYSYAI